MLAIAVFLGNFDLVSLSICDFTAIKESVNLKFDACPLIFCMINCKWRETFRVETFTGHRIIINVCVKNCIRDGIMKKNELLE